jgi:hypothetical protein
MKEMTMTENVEFTPEQQREQEISEVLEKLKFMESQGVDPHVTPGGKFGAFIPGRHRPPAGTIDWSKVGACIEALEQMYRSEEKHKIIIEAWGRFEDEEY